MLFGLLFLSVNVAVGLAQTTSVSPTWAQLYYKKAPVNAGLDFGTPNGKHDDYAQPVVPKEKRKVKNFILVIPDGFGPASETLGRQFYQWKNNQTWNHQMPADELLIGSVRTRASDTFVTDSAASATAYSAGVKTYNGGIALNDYGFPLGTVLEAAHLQGMLTGLVTTSRITHATPASFIAHIYDRDREDKIAEMEVGEGHPMGPVVDVMLGGGRCFFLPNTTTGSCRKDTKDVIAIGRKNGYNVFSDRAGFDGLQEGKNATKPYLGIFTSGHMAYEVDRNNSKEPSLLEMSKTALNTLKKWSEEKNTGYFIMIEAARIDHAGHSNDPVGHLHDILMYNEVINFVKEWIDENPDTTMLSVADHECGGLTIGGELGYAPEYCYMPQYLDSGKHSAEFLQSQWNSYNGSDAEGYLKKSIFEAYGIMDPNATEIEIATAQKNKTSFRFDAFLGNALSSRALIKWSTLGHTGVDVNLLGYGPNHETMAGNHDNTEIAEFIVQSLGLNLSNVTKILNSNAAFLENYVGTSLVEDGIVQKKSLARRAHSDHHC